MDIMLVYTVYCISVNIVNLYYRKWSSLTAKMVGSTQGVISGGFTVRVPLIVAGAPPVESFNVPGSSRWPGKTTFHPDLHEISIEIHRFSWCFGLLEALLRGLLGLQRSHQA